jgi:hypothetical protein
MKKLIAAASVLTLAVFIRALVAVAADEPPKMPAPEKEHAWLQQLVGEWDASAEMTEPGKPPTKCKGTETVRALGAFWIQSENKMHVSPEMTVTGILTLGYDPQKKKYVGTWVDSMTSTLWTYEGTVDEAGKRLTLDTEGAMPMNPAKRHKFKEVIELKGKDEKVFTSSVLGDDGKWTTFMTIKSTRRK